MTNVKATIPGATGNVVRAADRITIAYVMGYGRSGSTLLDVMLGGHPRVTSVGEVSYLSEWMRENKRCACHRPIRECDFWGSVMREYEIALGDGGSLPREAERQVESRMTLLRLLSGRLPANTVARYNRVQTALFEAVGQVAGSRIIVDSSKSVQRTDGRSLALQKFTDFDVKVIHLVRDGRAVTWSALKGPGTSDVAYRELPPFLRGAWTITDWVITNLVCLVLASRLLPGSVMRVRYEDLVRDPRSELAKIGDFVGVDLTGISESISLGKPLSPGHNVGGNRLRFASAIRLKEDCEWQDKLPWIYKILYWLVAWPLARRLGYRHGSG